VTSSSSNETEERFFEIWLNQRGTFVLHSQTPAPLGAGQVVFADFSNFKIP
jgi:hypothetical protein